jgi:hypothetical protein
MVRLNNALLPSALSELRYQLLDLLPGRTPRLRSIVARNIALAATLMELTDSQFFFDSSKEKLRLRYMLRYGSSDLRVIHLVRDIPGWAASYRKHSHDLPLKVIARRWNAINNIYWYQQPAARRLIIHYEDITAQPLATLARIFEFIKVENMAFKDRAAFDLALNDYETDHHIIGNVSRKQARKGVPFILKEDLRWKEVFSEDEIRLLLDETRVMRGTLGYNVS